MDTKPINTNDTEIILQRGNLCLRVAPLGASLRGLWRETPEGRADIITGYQGAENKAGGQGDILIPFPGRVKDGAYHWQGKAHQLTKTDKEGPNAIHGFLRHTVWDIASQTPTQITFSGGFDADANPGYPFALRARVSYELASETEMVCAFSVENVGRENIPAPVGAGFHPYFTVGGDFIDTSTLHVPFDATLEMQNLVPTGTVLPVENSPLDFRAPRPIGPTVFNTCYAQPIRGADNKAVISLTSANGDRSLHVWMDTAFGFVVLYSGDPLPDSHRRKSLAIEPMTCGSDAFNHPEWGLVSLAPGETWGGLWGVKAG